MSEKLFDNLVKIGNNNPDLRDDIAPILHYLKKSEDEDEKEEKSEEEGTESEQEDK